jgi:hypothetical protein
VGKNSKFSRRNLMKVVRDEHHGALF